jgi:hypothetical protein
MTVQAKVCFDETTFNMPVIVNSYNCNIWGSSPPSEYLKHESDTPVVMCGVLLKSAFF